MCQLRQQLASHPLGDKKPYNAIKFVRVDGNGTPLYTVSRLKMEVGAAVALKIAFEQFGAHCFHCKQWMPPQKLSHSCTKDHVRPKCDGGSNHLHNLVFSCGSCNRSKGECDLIGFKPETGSEYMRALDAHLDRCIAMLANS